MLFGTVIGQANTMNNNKFYGETETNLALHRKTTPTTLINPKNYGASQQLITPHRNLLQKTL